MEDRRCHYCQQAFQPHLYHPQQQVCSQAACQRRRRSDYHRQRIASDPVYQQVCLESPRKWRRANPDYWRKYRQDHPEQVERNRRQQRVRDQKRRFVNLANNNLAHGQVLFFQSPDPSGLLSAASCKQHPSCAVPTAGLKVHPCCQGSSSRVFGLRDFGIILRGPCFKALLELYLRQATPRSPLADISGQLNTSSIGPLGPACR